MRPGASRPRGAFRPRGDMGRRAAGDKLVAPGSSDTPGSRGPGSVGRRVSLALGLTLRGLEAHYLTAHVCAFQAIDALDARLIDRFSRRFAMAYGVGK